MVEKKKRISIQKVVGKEYTITGLRFRDELKKNILNPITSWTFKALYNLITCSSKGVSRSPESQQSLDKKKSSCGFNTYGLGGYLSHVIWIFIYALVGPPPLPIDAQIKIGIDWSSGFREDV